MIRLKSTKSLCIALCVVFVFTMVFTYFVDMDISFASTKQNQKVTLTFLIDKDTNRAGMEAVMKKIEDKYGIVTKIEIRPGGLEGENYIRTRLAAADMCDLSYFNSGALFQTLNPAVNFVDLSKEPWMANVSDSFKKVVSVKNGVFAIPATPTDVGGWFYNRKVYKKLGLSIPKTWAELMQNCEKIKKAGIIPVIASYKDSWTSQLIHLVDYYNV